MNRLCTVCRRGYATAELPKRPPRSPRSPRAPPPNVSSLPTLLKTLTQHKTQNRRPNPSAYIAIIRAAGDYALGRDVDSSEADGLGWQVALSAWEDAKRGGLDLGEEGLNQLMRFATVYPHILPTLLLQSTPPPISSYHALARAAQGNLEQLVLIIIEMFKQNIPPTVATIRQTIKLACEWGYPRLALQVAQKDTTRRLEQSAYAEILTASADNQYLHGVEYAWEKLRGSYVPDEGLILSMLNTAGRWGKPDLASSLLEYVTPQEQHLAPLLEAFCNAGQVPSAFTVIRSLREAGLTPTMATVQPIIAVLTTTELIDQAYYAMEDSKVVDILALNAVIAASANLGDLQRVRATQSAVTKLGAVPNVDTFNLVLDCCIAARHRSLGDTILSEMVAAGITPDNATYERMVELCLTQPTYEDAFYYLEKCKTEGAGVPGYKVYEALIKKCIPLQDTRWRLVMEEMKLAGHRVESDLMEFVNSGGKRRDERGRRRANDQMIGEKRRRWIKE